MYVRVHVFYSIGFHVLNANKRHYTVRQMIEINSWFDLVLLVGTTECYYLKIKFELHIIVYCYVYDYLSVI